MRWNLGLTMLLCSGCGSESKPVITLSEVVGLWTITLTEVEPCDRNNPAVALNVNLSVFGETDATQLTLAGTWELAPVTNPNRPLEGEIDLETGHFTAEIRSEPPQGSPNPTARALLTGTIVDYGTMTAELEDPISTAAGVLGTGRCQYTAEGRR